MGSSQENKLKAVILYDSKTSGGSTEALIDAIGLQLAESGAYVEKVKCKALADYSFIREFDLVILGAPVYYFLVASQLLGALNYGNLKINLKRKKIAMFLTCGSPEAMAAVLYLPQLKIHLVRNKILVEKIFPSNALQENSVIDTFVQDVLYEYSKTLKSRIDSLKWTLEAQDWLDSVPSFLQGKIKEGAEEFAKAMGYKEITCDVLEEAKGEIGG